MMHNSTSQLEGTNSAGDQTHPVFTHLLVESMKIDCDQTHVDAQCRDGTKNLDFELIIGLTCPENLHLTQTQLGKCIRMLCHVRHVSLNPLPPIRSNMRCLVATIDPRRVCTVKLGSHGIGNFHPLVTHIRVVEVREHIYNRPDVDEGISEPFAVCVHSDALHRVNRLFLGP